MIDTQIRNELCNLGGTSCWGDKMWPLRPGNNFGARYQAILIPLVALAFLPADSTNVAPLSTTSAGHLLNFQRK